MGKTFESPGGKVAQYPLSGAATLPAARAFAAPPQDNPYVFCLGGKTQFFKQRSRAARTTARWKSRKAGKRALRYIFSCGLLADRSPAPLGNPRSRMAFA